MSSWSIIVHGGAKTIDARLAEAHRQGCLAAASAGVRVLSAGGSAIEAAVEAVRTLEDDPTFNAGYGSVLNADGEVELDAAVMDGATLDVGAVGALRGVKNPIEVAHRMLRDRPTFLVGGGAQRYAQSQGINLIEPSSLIAPTRQAQPCDTVGCVAMDSNGDIAAATSTGGLEGVRPGRIGDSPIPGCGLYAENGVGGVSFSGDGESILRLTLAARLMHDLEGRSASEAANTAIGRMVRVGGEAGCIVLDSSGRPAFSHNSDHFAVALATHNRPARAFLHMDEHQDD